MISEIEEILNVISRSHSTKSILYQKLNYFFIQYLIIIQIGQTIEGWDFLLENLFQELKKVLSILLSYQINSFDLYYVKNSYYNLYNSILNQLEISTNLII